MRSTIVLPLLPSVVLHWSIAAVTATARWKQEKPAPSLLTSNQAALANRLEYRLARSRDQSRTMTAMTGFKCSKTETLWHRTALKQWVRITAVYKIPVFP